MANTIQHVGVLTAGDDGPGMNAAVRSAVRMALEQGWTVTGIQQGFHGLLRGQFVELESRSVSHIIDLGGTFLGTSSGDILEDHTQLLDTFHALREQGIDGLVVIGGRRALDAARALNEGGMPTVGVPASSENDLWGIDVAIGVDTALNTAIEAIDHIQDTALSQHKAFVIEIMGRHSGYLTLMASIAGGAEVTCIAEAPFDLEDVAEEVAAAYRRDKGHCLIVVAEGAEPDAHSIHSYLNEHQDETGFEANLTMLGHMQRGGTPTAKDRFLATRLGAAAVQALADGKHGVMVGTRENRLVYPSLTDVIAREREIDMAYLELATVLAQ
jgi:6-phosphofructokinase 1